MTHNTTQPQIRYFWRFMDDSVPFGSVRFRWQFRSVPFGSVGSSVRFRSWQDLCAVSQTSKCD